MSSLVILNHFVFAAAVLGVSIVLVIAVMTTIFFRHFRTSDDLDNTTAELTLSLRTGGVAIVGAFLAGWFIAPLVGVGTINQNNFSVASVLVSLVGAVILLAIVNLVRRGRVR